MRSAFIVITLLSLLLRCTPFYMSSKTLPLKVIHQPSRGHFTSSSFFSPAVNRHVDPFRLNVLVPKQVSSSSFAGLRLQRRFQDACKKLGKKLHSSNSSNSSNSNINSNRNITSAIRNINLPPSLPPQATTPQPPSNNNPSARSSTV